MKRVLFLILFFFALSSHAQAKPNILCQIQDLSDTTDIRLAEIGQRYSHCLTAYADPAMQTKLKAENPTLLVDFFLNPHFYWADRPEWYLKLADGSPVMYEGQHVYDLRIPEFQDFYAAEIAGLLTSGLMDRVFLDTMEEKVIFTGPLGEMPVDYSPNAWAYAQYQFFDKVNVATGGKVCTNSSSRVPGSLDSGNHGFRYFSTCQSIEAYSKFMAYDTSEWTKYWYLEQTILTDVANANGKDMFIEVTGDATNIESRLFALSSFLLVQEDNTHFYFRDSAPGNETNLLWYPEQDAPIGDPVGVYGTDWTQGNYFRIFTGGKVFVNGLNFPITVDTTGYKNWDGTPVANPMTMPPFSGRILIHE